MNTTKKQNYVAYYRVSTEEQGKSGLGLRAQKRDVTDYINNNGNLVGEFQDVESGASEERRGIAQAIESCKLHKAILVVKEISRISRGGFKIREALERSDIDFIEASSPHDPELVKDIKFSLAKEERKKLAHRTKSALAEIQAKLDRGEVHVSKAGNVVTSLGMAKNLTQEGRDKSLEVRKSNAYNNPENLRAGAFIVSCKKSGDSFPVITDKLNQFGFKTRKGGTFALMQVHRLYDRYKNDL